MKRLPRPQIEPSALAQRYAQVRAQSLALAEPLSEADAQVQSMPDVEPDQVAPRARDVVLRDLHPRAPRARLQAVPSAVSRAVQQLLQPGRRAASAGAAGPGVAPEPGRGQGLSRPGRPAHGRPAGATRTIRASTCWSNSACSTSNSTRSCCSPTSSTCCRATRWRRCTADRGRLRTVAPLPMTWVEQAGGLVEIGHDGAGFAFDNETPAPRGSTCGPTRSATGWSRMANGPSSSPTAATPSRAGGCRRAGIGCAANRCARRCTGSATNAASGSASRCTGWCRSIRTRRSPT